MCSRTLAGHATGMGDSKESSPSKPKDGREGFVDAPLLFGGDVADHIAESPRVDRPYLLDQDAGCLAE